MGIVSTPDIQIHFSDVFRVDPDALHSYGAFNVSLINDLPLFVDPFLLFNSDKTEYRELHEEIINYLRFLRDKAAAGVIREGLLQAWYAFPEVRQNWLGYSLVGNAGRGLGMDFARCLHRNLQTVFSNFGEEQIARGSHLEKLCLVDDGVGRDSVSDFTTNLIKPFLLDYTQRFAREFLSPKRRRTVQVENARFDFRTETWAAETFELPFADDDFVLLTPRDILTKDEVWISKHDLFGDFRDVISSIPNNQIRDQINNYFLRVLPREPSRQEKQAAVSQTIQKYPVVIEHYIRYKEDRGERARYVSRERVDEVQSLFVTQARSLVSFLVETGFYRTLGDTRAEALERINYLKAVIEKKGGFRLFYVKGRPIRRETDLHILFRLCWFATPSDVSTEVDDGRGPADYKISRGAADKTIVEFKLASNSQLKRNLLHQVTAYKEASGAKSGLKVIIYFTESQLNKVRRILDELKLADSEDIILIDARADNKPSASKIA